MTTESKSTGGGQGWLNVLMRSREGSLVILIARRGSCLIVRDR